MTRAIKHLRKDKLIKEDEKLLFAEMDILKELDHPNIVKIYELYQDGKTYYIVTEFFFCCRFTSFRFLEGGELFDKLQREKVFTEKMAADCMTQILSAVQYCHERQIVHR
jgi:calcium-dependent protein kinase